MRPFSKSKAAVTAVDDRVPTTDALELKGLLVVFFLLSQP